MLTQSYFLILDISQKEAQCDPFFLVHYKHWSRNADQPHLDQVVSGAVIWQ